MFHIFWHALENETVIRRRHKAYKDSFVACVLDIHLNAVSNILTFYASFKTKTLTLILESIILNTYLITIVH